MAGAWCFDCPPALQIFQQASEVLGYDLLEVCKNGPAEQLNTTAISQPALLVTSLAMLEVLRLQKPLRGAAYTRVDLVRVMVVVAHTHTHTHTQHNTTHTGGPSTG